MDTLKAPIEILRPLSFLALCKMKMDDSADLPPLLENLEERLDSVKTADVDPVVFWNLSKTYALMGDGEKKKFYLKMAYDKVVDIKNQIRARYAEIIDVSVYFMKSSMILRITNQKMKVIINVLS